MAIVTPQAVASAITATTTTKAPESRQQDTVVDPAKDAAAAESKTEDPAAKLADLARKEAALVKKMREIAAKEAAQKEQEPELQSKFEATFKDSLKQRLNEDPLGILESEFGISADALTQAILNPRSALPPEVLKMREELNGLKTAQQNQLKAQEEQKTAGYQKAVEEIRTKVTKLAESDERFQTVKELGLTDAAVELIEQTFTSENRLMTNEEALEAVEEYALNESVRIANLKKVQDKLKPQEPKPEVPGTTQPRTLTNRDAQTTSRGPLTAKQRIENAIAVGEGRPKPH